MPDFLSDCLQTCFEYVGFSHRNAENTPLYSELCDASNSLLCFAPPSLLTIRIGKNISSKLKSVYSIGVPNTRSAGFLYSTMDVYLNDHHSLFDSHVIAPICPDNGPQVSGNPANIPMSSCDSKPTNDSGTSHENTRHSLLYARLFEDYRLEAVVAQKLSRSNLLLVSGISYWDPQPTFFSQGHATSSNHNKLSPSVLESPIAQPPSHFEAQLIHKSRNWSADVSYCSTDNVVGTSLLAKVPFFHNWAAGAEVVYTGAENSGGISLGAKWVKPHERGVASILTFLCNPMMGYMNTTYTSTIRRNWVMSTSYDFNTYSYNSDLAVGVAYSPTDTDERLLKCRFSMTQGLALLLEGKFKRAILTLGVATSLGFGNSTSQSIGFEVQFL